MGSKRDRKKKPDGEDIEMTMIGTDGALGDKKVVTAGSGPGISQHHDGSFTNNNILVMTPSTAIPCRIPRKILSIMLSIQRLMLSGMKQSTEFGVYLKGEFIQGVLYVMEDYYFPRQTVSSTYIHFGEPEPDSSYNGVMHRHPDGCKSFSSVDEQSINRNYDFSLLFVSDTIHLGIMNFKYYDQDKERTIIHRYPLQISIVDDDNIDIDESILERVSAYRPTYTGGNGLFKDFDELGDDPDLRKMMADLYGADPRSGRRRSLNHKGSGKVSNLLRRLEVLEASCGTQSSDLEKCDYIGNCPHCATDIGFTGKMLPTKLVCTKCKKDIEPSGVKWEDQSVHDVPIITV